MRFCDVNPQTYEERGQQVRLRAFEARKKNGPPLCGTPGLPTGREEFDNPSVALLADHPAHRSLQGPHRRPCLLAPRNDARTVNPLPQPRQKRRPTHAGCTRASHTRTRLPTSRSIAPPPGSKITTAERESTREDAPGTRAPLANHQERTPTALMRKASLQRLRLC